MNFEIARRYIYSSCTEFNSLVTMKCEFPKKEFFSDRCENKKIFFSGIKIGMVMRWWKWIKTEIHFSSIYKIKCECEELLDYNIYDIIHICCCCCYSVSLVPQSASTQRIGNISVLYKIIFLFIYFNLYFFFTHQIKSKNWMRH